MRIQIEIRSLYVISVCKNRNHAKFNVHHMQIGGLCKFSANVRCRLEYFVISFYCPIGVGCQ